MSNCLVTKLTTSVEDDSLEKLGCICLDVDTTGLTNIAFKITPSAIHSKTDNITISLINSGTFAGYYLVTGVGKVWIEKYDIEEITSMDPVSFQNTIINLDELKYCNKLSKIGSENVSMNINFTGNLSSLIDKKMTILMLSVESKYYKCSTYGDVSILKNMPLKILILRNQPDLYGDISDIISDVNKLTFNTFNIFDNTYITGDVKSLLECVNITNLTLYNGKLTGNLDDLFTAWSTAGKTTNCKIIIGNTSLVSSITKDFVSHEISFDGVGGWSEVEA